MDKELKKFIKLNKKTLQKLFEWRMKELKEILSNLDLSDKNLEIKYRAFRYFLDEMRQWLISIKIISEKKDKKDSFI